MSDHLFALPSDSFKVTSDDCYTPPPPHPVAPPATPGRTTRKWLDDLGAPFCPCGTQMKEA